MQFRRGLDRFTDYAVLKSREETKGVKVYEVSMRRCRIQMLYLQNLLKFTLLLYTLLTATLLATSSDNNRT